MVFPHGAFSLEGEDAAATFDNFIPVKKRKSSWQRPAPSRIARRKRTEIRSRQRTLECVEMFEKYIEFPSRSVFIAL